MLEKTRFNLDRCAQIFRKQLTHVVRRLWSPGETQRKIKIQHLRVAKIIVLERSRHDWIPWQTRCLLCAGRVSTERYIAPTFSFRRFKGWLEVKYVLHCTLNTRNKQEERLEWSLYFSCIITWTSKVLDKSIAERTLAPNLSVPLASWTNKHVTIWLQLKRRWSLTFLTAFECEGPNHLQLLWRVYCCARSRRRYTQISDVTRKTHRFYWLSCVRRNWAAPIAMLLLYYDSSLSLDHGMRRRLRDRLSGRGCRLGSIKDSHPFQFL